jgi:DNA mismatch endonuclease (patch repair protein)
MSKIRSRDTQPELAVRRLAFRMGLRYRLHRRDLPGRPDIVFSQHKLALFVHGCFWHRHPGCPNCTQPKTRPEFWDLKFRANVQRDHHVQQALKDLGWQPLVIWECETVDEQLVADTLECAITKRLSASPGKNVTAI